MILAPPPNGYRLDWETFDLLRAAGRQAASYLAEEHSTRALVDSRALNEFSKRFAFVVHDFKNLASQLGMVVANARRHMDNPEFRSDMLETLESSVARMNRLLEQMRAGSRQTPPQIIEPDAVIADMAQELSALGTPIQTRLDAGDCKVAIDRDQFRSILSHLINNAREAAPNSSDVVVASRRKSAVRSRSMSSIPVPGWMTSSSARSSCDRFARPNRAEWELGVTRSAKCCGLPAANWR